jgi:protein TonB
VRQAASLKRVFRSATGGIIAPTVIPEKIAILKEEPLPPDIVGVTGGVPGGVPGGQAGGVLGSILQDASRMAPPAPRPLERSAPVRVGGRVQPPRPIFTPQPIYPALAKQTKVQGDVRIDAVIDEQGNIVEMRVLSGHPLLVNAALNAVSQWKYEPTLLNERPVAVQFVVTVQFRLTGAP